MGKPVALEARAEERETRVMLRRDVSILKDRRGGPTKPMSLEVFRRERLPGGDFDHDDWGSCGCFMGDDA
jgi:hypothetical protein